MALLVCIVAKRVQNIIVHAMNGSNALIRIWPIMKFYIFSRILLFELTTYWIRINTNVHEQWKNCIRNTNDLYSIYWLHGTNLCESFPTPSIFLFFILFCFSQLTVLSTFCIGCFSPLRRGKNILSLLESWTNRSKCENVCYSCTVAFTIVHVMQCIIIINITISYPQSKVLILHNNYYYDFSNYHLKQLN